MGAVLSSSQLSYIVSLHIYIFSEITEPNYTKLSLGGSFQNGVEDGDPDFKKFEMCILCFSGYMAPTHGSLQQQLEHANQKAGFNEENKYKMQQVIILC